MTARDIYQAWLHFDGLLPNLREELLQIEDNEAEINERFCAPLSFGTAGLRGIIRAGTNGMNIYTVCQATQGLAQLILDENAAKRGCVIASDTRIMSEEFSKACAEVLAGNGIKAYIFDAPRPTPELSFTLRHLCAVCGINITASHNPKIYNGYKAYWEDGAQISPEQAKIVADTIAEVDIFTGVKKMPFDEGIKNGLIEIIGEETDEAYLSAVLAEQIRPDAVKKVADTFGVVYTPFHGTGRLLVPEVLRRIGIKKLYPVAEQMTPDGNFPTVKSPNPEDKEGFTLAIAIAEKENCNLIIGTDPDADRTGVIVRTNDGEYLPLTGNQIGAMLLSYIIEARQLSGKLPANAAAVRSIVSTSLADKICEANGVTMVKVLTGFKFIGEKIKQWEASHEHTYIFGFEESYGYLSGAYARDKDAVCASMLITEMAAYYANKGKSLYDVLLDLFDKYGYHMEQVESIVMPGLDGLKKMADCMTDMRSAPESAIAGIPVQAFADFKTGTVTHSGGKTEPTGLPSSDVLYYTLDGGDRVIVRPSGTEPKIKIYYLVSGKDSKVCQAKIAAYKAHMANIMKTNA